MSEKQQLDEKELLLMNKNEPNDEGTSTTTKEVVVGDDNINHIDNKKTINENHHYKEGEKIKNDNNKNGNEDAILAIDNMDINNDVHDDDDNGNVDNNNNNDGNNNKCKNNDVTNNSSKLNNNDDEYLVTHINGECRLQYAIRKLKPMDQILELIKLLPMDVKHMNRHGKYPLHTACEVSCNEIIMKLIDIYPEAAQIPNCGGLHPLHLLLGKDLSKGFVYKEDIVMKLIEISPITVTVVVPNYGTVLHWACYNMLSETLLKKLIQMYPFATQVQDHAGHYPIFIATCLNNTCPIPIIQLLLDNHPLGTQQRNKDNACPIHLAYTKKNYDLVQYLMQRSDFQINIKGTNGMTLLHYACLLKHDDENILDMLLLHPDVDVNATDSQNNTPLHKLLPSESNGFSSKICISMIQKLLHHPFILIDTKNNDNKTPLDMITDHINNRLLVENPNKDRFSSFLIEREYYNLTSLQKNNVLFVDSTVGLSLQSVNKTTRIKRKG